jgi:radixin
MQEILASLDSDLESSKDASKFSKLDELHVGNQMAGKDKFKTLRLIRAGNTRERIQMFENL